MEIQYLLPYRAFYFKCGLGVEFADIDTQN